MDGLIQNLIQSALQARYERIIWDQSLVPWTFQIVLSGFALLLVFVLLVVLYLTLFERKFLGWIQVRLGPNRVGPWGLLQPFADMIKLLIKEDIVPRDSDRILHLIAPLAIFIPTMLAFVTIPFGMGTVELKQELVSPSFGHAWYEWVGPELYEEHGFDEPGYIEAPVAVEVNEDAHKTYWIPSELDHEPRFIPSDDRGEIPGDVLDENGVPLNVRFRPFEIPAILQRKPASASDPPDYGVFIDMVDFRETGRQYDVLEIRWGRKGDHDNIIELGIDGGIIDDVEEEFSEILSGIDPSLPYEDRYKFQNTSVRTRFEQINQMFARSIAINNRKFSNSSMVPAFGNVNDLNVSSRDIYTPNWDHVAYIHGAVGRSEEKGSLYFYPVDAATTEESEQLTGLEEFEWTNFGSSFRLQRITDQGYVMETPDGEIHQLINVGDSVTLPLGSDQITLTLKDTQFYHIYLVGKDLGIGILYILSVTSLTVLGIFMGGFAANNKWSLFGALRSAAQMMSYEIPMTLAVMGPVVMTGSLSMIDIVEQGQRSVWFVIPQFLAFYVFMVCMTAEVNRSPFDIPEAESELVAGFHTEYSGLKFGFFFLAEYANMFIAAAVMTVLFFGGWHSPVIPGLGALDIPFAGEFLGSFIWFMLKTTFWLAVFIWFRGTFPRFRVDQMMDYAWKALLPIAMLNIVITSYLQYSDWHFRIWQFNNWYIYNGYIKPLFASDLTSTYGIPIITLVSILLATDIIGAVSKTRTQEWRRILIFIAIVAAALAVLNYMKVYHLI